MGKRTDWLAALSLAALAMSCGGSGDETPVDDAGRSSAAGDGDDLEILFPRLYSGYDGVHAYRVPVKVVGLRNATFTASDPSMVTIVREGSGAMITTRKAGEVTIFAALHGMRGSAKLTITAYTPEQWRAGENRYNHGEPYKTPDVDPCNPPTDVGFSGKLSCTNCHGVTGTLFSDIRHNPTQIGGYSDAELAAIFTQGQKPPGTPERFVDLAFWSSFHKWEVSERERVGVIAYLRSLEPRELGSIWDFGGSPQQDAGTAEDPVEMADPKVPVCDAGVETEDGSARRN